ncbi:unnamed protein product, partial [Clonostachys rosea]
MPAALKKSIPYTWAHTDLCASDPEDDLEITQVADLGREQVRAAIDAAQAAFTTYSKTPHRERRWLMRRWGDLIKANREDLAALCTLELGKPWTESLGSV